MSDASNIVLADAQATPVNHTFIPVGRDKNGVFWYEDQSQTNTVGFWRVSIDLKKPPVAVSGDSAAGRTARAVIGLHEPVLENVSNSTVSGILPAPTVAYVPRSITEYVLPERSTLLDRQNLRKMNHLLQNHADVIGTVENLIRYS